MGLRRGSCAVNDLAKDFAIGRPGPESLKWMFSPLLRILYGVR